MSMTMQKIEKAIDDAVEDVEQYNDVDLFVKDVINPLRDKLQAGVNAGLYCNERRIQDKFAALERAVSDKFLRKEKAV